MKAALVFPRTMYKSGDPPLGIAYIAAYLRKNTDAQINIIDPTHYGSLSYVYDRLKYLQPDIVGIYFDTIMYKNSIKTAEYAKRLGSITVAGGPHATILPQSLIKDDNIDIVTIGEGEQTFTEIVRAFKSKDWKNIPGIFYKEGGKIIENQPRPLVEDINLLPMPARDLLEMDKYISSWYYLDSIDTGLTGTNIIASRGCPFRCSYCQPTLEKIFGRKLKLRNPENVISEMESLKSDYNIKGAFFHDDTITADKRWINNFCSLLKKSRLDIRWGCNTRADTIDDNTIKLMKDAGLANVHLGIESANQRILDDVYQKGIKTSDVKTAVSLLNKNKVTIMGFFMLGAPGETKQEIKNTIRFASNLNIQEATFSIVSPLPKTGLYDLVEKLKFPISNNFEDFNYYSSRAFKDGLHTYKELKKLQLEALMAFYIKPNRIWYILKHFLSIRGAAKLIRKLTRFYK